MPNINFVPDDYIQSKESRRSNLLCLVLFLIVMAGLVGSYVTIRIRLHAYNAREQLVNNRMSQLQELIRKYEELQTKRKAMMRSALTTAELLEPVPKSVLLAALTNNLPSGVSLLDLKMRQEEPKKSAYSPQPKPASNYQAAQTQQTGSDMMTSLEKSLETHIEIGGMAPSDLQVADYMKNLERSTLLYDVDIVESKAREVEGTIFREFKLEAKMRRDIHLTKNDVDLIRKKAELSIYQF